MKQPACTLNRGPLKRFPTRKYYVSNIDEQWQMDSADMVQAQSKTKASVMF